MGRMPDHRYPMPLTPAELRQARATLGELWGLGRPLSAAELGSRLRLSSKGDPGDAYRSLERGHGTISGPLTVALLMMLAGAPPPDGFPDP